MSAYFSQPYPDLYCLHQFSPLANQSEYPTIIASANYVDPQIPTPSTPSTFTLSDLYAQQESTLLYFSQPADAYPQLSGSDYTGSPLSTGYMSTPVLVQNQLHQSPTRHMRGGVRPDPSPMSFIPETDPIPSIRRASLPPSPLAITPSGTAPSSPLTQAPSRSHSETSSFGLQRRGEGYRSSSSTPTPSPTLSPAPDSGYRSSSSQLKQTDFRRRRADRRRSKLLEIASVLPFRATDPDEMSSHDKRRCYVGTLEGYVIWLEKEMKFSGGDPITMKKVAKHKGMTCRSLRTMLAHFQDEAHRLHEQVQAQEREALELQATLEEEEFYDQEPGFEPMASSAPSCTPISSPFTTVPIQSLSHLRPQLSASQLQGYEC